MADAYMPAIPHGYGRQLRFVKAVFSVNSTGEPSLVSHAALAEAGLATAVRTAAGKYTFTTSERWPKLVGVDAHYAAAGDAEDLYAQCGVPSGVAHATNVVTFVVRTKTAGTNTDPAAATNYLTVDLWFEDLPT